MLLNYGPDKIWMMKKKKIWHKQYVSPSRGDIISQLFTIFHTTCTLISRNYDPNPDLKRYKLPRHWHPRTMPIRPSMDGHNLYLVCSSQMNWKPTVCSKARRSHTGISRTLCYPVHSDWRRTWMMILRADSCIFLKGHWKKIDYKIFMILRCTMSFDLENSKYLQQSISLPKQLLMYTCAWKAVLIFYFSTSVNGFILNNQLTKEGRQHLLIYYETNFTLIYSSLIHRFTRDSARI